MAVTDITSGANPATTIPATQSVAGGLPVLVWLYLFSVIVPIGFQAGPLALTTLRLILMVMIIPLLFRLFTGRYGKIYATDILFVLHLAWSTVALAANNPSAVIEQTGSVGVEFLGGYVLGRAYIRSRAAFAALIRAFVVLVLIMLPFALFETLTSRSLWIEVLQALPAVTTVREITSESRNLFGLTLERVQLGFAHPIHFGVFCSMAFSLCLVGMNGIFTTPRRRMSGAALAAAACLSLSSGPMLAIILQGGLIIWALMLAQVAKRWWILVGIGVLMYVAIDLLSNRSPLRVFMSYATFSAHNAFWRATIFEWGMKNVWANPILGIGLNDWFRPAYMIGSSVDNFWLLMAMRYGIPGFLVLAAGYVLVLARLMRRDFHADPVLTNFRLAWVFTFLGLSFTLCTVHVWSSIYSFTFFLFSSGIWMIAEQPQDPGADPKPEDTATGRKQVPFARSFAAEPTAATRADAAPVATARPADTPRYSRFPSSDES